MHARTAARGWGRLSTTMRIAVVGLVATALAGTAWACADETEYPIWRLAAPDFSDVGRPALTPGNDTRINLIWLMRSLHPISDGALTYRAPDWSDQELGHSFLTWPVLRSTYWPQADQGDSAAFTTACIPPAGPIAAFTAVVAGDRSLPAADRTTLLAVRGKLGCQPVAAQVAMMSAQGRDYLAYLRAGAAFYAGDWQAARDGFAHLTRAGNPWIAETAAYMPIRIALRAATAKAVDQYGNFDVKAVDPGEVAAARTAIAAYLTSFPNGRYATSARGLIRRTQWLSGDVAGLAHGYEHLIATTPADSARAANLVEEVDRILLDNPASDAVLRHDGTMPLLLAVADLRGMRRPVDGDARDRSLPLNVADLAAQAPVFAGHDALYGYLRATRAYYGGDAPATILATLPQDLRDPGATPLSYSRQLLRGMALAKAGDAGEVGFWTGLIAGARPLFERPFAELGLAMHWQRTNQLDRLFASGSPVTDRMTREIVMQTIAPAALLRQEAGRGDRPAHERAVARFTLLYKDLSRGFYADFGRDTALVPLGAAPAAVSDFAGDQPVADGLFTRGTWSDGYTCPAVTVTAARLARNAHDPGALLCLGDFWRLNGFDGFDLIQTDNGPDTLGHRPDRFPGTPLRRDAIYRAILADPRASGDDRAYALYRAVMCYAPSGYNACAGPSHSYADWQRDQRSKAERKVWFLELKRRYPDSRWARQLRYYW